MLIGSASPLLVVCPLSTACFELPTTRKSCSLQAPMTAKSVCRNLWSWIQWTGHCKPTWPSNSHPPRISMWFRLGSLSLGRWFVLPSIGRQTLVGDAVKNPGDENWGLWSSYCSLVRLLAFYFSSWRSWTDLARSQSAFDHETTRSARRTFYYHFQPLLLLLPRKVSCPFRCMGSPILSMACQILSILAITTAAWGF